jgi:hypothetical protein
LISTFAVISFFILVNTVRYFIVVKFESIEKKWKHELVSKKKKKGLILIIYLIISLILFIVIAPSLSV